MTRRLLTLLCACAAAGLAAASALSSAPPVGPLPPGPVETVRPAVGETFAVVLPKPKVNGRVWRVARAYDASVVRQVSETATRATYRAVGAGRTTIAYGLTLGERKRAYASHTVKVVVSAKSASGCPADLLPLTANPIGPAVTAALLADSAKNRPQVTGATIAPRDAQRGPQAKRQCGTKVWQRTVVVYITDRALLPSASLSERVFFVGRTRAGYRVWQHVR